MAEASASVMGGVDALGVCDNVCGSQDAPSALLDLSDKSPITMVNDRNGQDPRTSDADRTGDAQTSVGQNVVQATAELPETDNERENVEGKFFNNVRIKAECGNGRACRLINFWSFTLDILGALKRNHILRA